MRKAASDEVDDLRRGGLLPGGLDGLKEQPVDITQDACYVSRPPTRPISPPMLTRRCPSGCPAPPRASPRRRAHAPRAAARAQVMAKACELLAMEPPPLLLPLPVSLMYTHSLPP